MPQPNSFDWCKSLKALYRYTYGFGYYSCYHMKLKRFGKLLHSGHLKLNHPMAEYNHTQQQSSLSYRMNLKGYRYYRYVFGCYSCYHMKLMNFGKPSHFGYG